MPDWYLTKDGDKSCLELYERHYSAYKYKDGRKRYQFVGPGFNIVLRTARADAFFVWRKFIDDSGQTGINCAAFRNESPIQSSELVRQADAIADCAWPGERHYTYVDPKKIRRTNPRWRRGNTAKPGHCFLKAGWRQCGMTKSGLVILERPYGEVMDEMDNEAKYLPAENILADVIITMRHARVFITSREKMHPTGIQLYDELLAKLEARGVVGPSGRPP